MPNELIDIAVADFRWWLENHPDRAESALDALDALEPKACKLLVPSELAAYTDLQNLLGKALSRQ